MYGNTQLKKLQLFEKHAFFLRHTLLYYIILCYIMLYCIILYYIILYYIILYYIILIVPLEKVNFAEKEKIFD
jgi:hypothetical protein